MHHHRVAGLIGTRIAVVTTRPCRAPHHTIVAVGLIGGGPVLRTKKGWHRVLWMAAP